MFYELLKNMRRIALLFLCVSFKLSAQNYFKLGLKEGVNTSQVSGDTYSGFDKFGFVGGSYIKFKVKGEWTGGFEILFTQKGSRHRADYKLKDDVSYFLQLNYIEVPVLLQYNLIGANFEIGPSFGVLVKTKELITVGGVEYFGTRPFKTMETSINIGANYTFSSRFGFNLRYTNSLVTIRKKLVKTTKLYEGAQLNSVITVCLTYEFGGNGSVWK